MARYRLAVRGLSLGVFLLFLSGLGWTAPLPAQDRPTTSVKDQYLKQEVLIPMRDGVKLFTSIYRPKDTTQQYPIMMMRTPYSVGPYGKDKEGQEQYKRDLGPSHFFQEDGYIFVYQDVRGCWMSEGEFVNMRPHKDHKSSPQDIDEASDTYDTIEWLVKNIPNNNGKVGMWGISYPGFYAAAGMIDAHPALKAVSPQAPIADWWYDDFRHHGALFLPHAFNFLASFDRPRPKPTTERGPGFDHGTPDGYQFFLDIGPLKNADTKYFKGQRKFWNELLEHSTYDEFWQARNLLPHLKKVAPAVMTVGGWYDAEDLYGALKIYQATEKQNPNVQNMLVMGPWPHGGWSRGTGNRLGHVRFGSNTSEFYQEKIEFPFFQYHLKGKGELKLPEAYVFEVGPNRWRQFDQWPPKNAQQRSLHFQANEGLAFTPAQDGALAYDEYVSDPRKPVPFTEEISTAMTRPYMTDDQRFASRRPDVLVYQTEVLKEDVTLAGPMLADLWVSTSGTDSDFVVKVIDVFPADFSYPSDRPQTEQPRPQGGRRRFTPASERPMGGYQMMVRSEVIRGRFRNDPSKPEPFVPNQPAHIKLELQDVLHTFQKGHRIMVQVQSTWFPLVDRNPQKYVPQIHEANPEDFIKATQRIYRTPQHPSQLRVLVLPAS
jgi:hypothetical protein